MSMHENSKGKTWSLFQSNDFEIDYENYYIYGEAEIHTGIDFYKLLSGNIVTAVTHEKFLHENTIQLIDTRLTA